MYILDSHSHAHRVLESKNADYSVGDIVVGSFGWTTHTISDVKANQFKVIKLDPAIHTSTSTALGVLGMPG